MAGGKVEKSSRNKASVESWRTVTESRGLDVQAGRRSYRMTREGETHHGWLACKARSGMQGRGGVFNRQ